MGGTPCDFLYSLYLLTPFFSNYSNLEIRDPSSGNIALDVLDHLFNAFFFVELVLRLIAEGSSFFSRLNARFTWNLLDSALVVRIPQSTILQMSAHIQDVIFDRLV